MTRNELRGRQIAKKVMREMLARNDYREDVKQIAEQHVANYTQNLYARKHINIYCRQLTGALRKMK